MKTLIFTALFILSNSAFSSEKTFECNARYVFGDKKSASLKGEITSDTSLADIVYSIDEQVEFDASLLTIEKNVTSPKFAFHQQFKISDSSHTLYMPESMNNMDHFTAIIGNGKTFDKLECFVEN